MQGDVEDADFNLPRQYDVIVLLHLLEHLHEPEAAFRRLVACVKDGGIIVGGFPAMPDALAGWWQRRIRKTAARFGHVSVFSPRRIRTMAGDDGLSLELLTGAYLARSSGSVLENCRWWVRGNLAFGNLFPGWAGELYWAMRKPVI